MSGSGCLIEELHGFKIFKTEHNYIIYNTAMEWTHEPPYGHCHNIKSLKTCREVIENVFHRRIPQTHVEWLLVAHIRLADDVKYREMLVGLMERRLNRDHEHYFNSNKGVRR